jgi:hypothetical protein
MAKNKKTPYVPTPKAEVVVKTSLTELAKLNRVALQKKRQIHNLQYLQNWDAEATVKPNLRPSKRARAVRRILAGVTKKEEK